MIENNITYALKDNVLVHISEVESGLRCDCICPGCGEQLVAKKGDFVTHHFAHKSKKECEYGYQTSVHLLAKDIIAKLKIFKIPDLYVAFSRFGKKVLVRKSGFININEVVLEKKINDIVPDILLKTDEGDIIVEIYVTHQIDEDKKEKIKRLGISTIEIDLSHIKRTITEGELKYFFDSDTENKQWIFWDKTEKILDKFYKVSEILNIHSNGNVYGCPIKRRKWNDKYYARVLHDCNDCDYCIDLCEQDELGNNKKIICSGRSKIASMEDFNKSAEQRQKEYDKKREEEDMDCITQGICPQCGGQLRILNGRYGEFFGCKEYPRCHFTFRY